MPKPCAKLPVWSVYAAAAVMLGVAGWSQTHRQKAHGADAYHAGVADAIRAAPRQIGPWTGVDVDLPPEAVRVLRPTATASREYTRADQPDVAPQLLIVHSQDARDLQGHYPPNCYPHAGYEPAGSEAATWTIGGHEVRGVRYRFRTAGASFTVAQFFVLPGVGPGADMNAVYARASDARLRRFGAGQAQVLIEGQRDTAQRHEIETELFQAVAPWVEAAWRAEAPDPAPAS
ncbi:MAG: exosortase-associated EpsI family protein [Planctomycetota bacterium]